MPWWWWVIDVLGLIVIGTVVVLLALAVRRRVLTRRGAFDMSVNRRPEPGAAGWMLGVAVYSAGTLDWYRTFSFRLRPRYRFVRGEMEVEGRRQPRGSEAHAVYAGHVVVAVGRADQVRQLSVSAEALTGLLAWLESSPPGRSVNRVL